MWLVIYDRCNLPLETTPLAPQTDLHGTLETARQLRTAAGWTCDEIGDNAFFFCARDGVRVGVHIQPRHPDSITVGHH